MPSDYSAHNCPHGRESFLGSKPVTINVMDEFPGKSGSKKTCDPEHDAGRRGFFAQCFRDVLSPVARMIEQRIQPVTDALQGGITGGAPEDEPPDMPDMAQIYADPLRRPAEVILRPPGAGPAEEFETLCSRCGGCVEVCPVKCIQIDTSAQTGGGFPYIVPVVAPCVVCAELACMKACPTGALALVEKFQIRMGLARVDHRTCLRRNGEDCRLCLEACPIGADAILVSPTTGRVLVKSNGCVGCGMCEQTCPVQPAAISVHPPRRAPEPVED